MQNRRNAIWFLMIVLLLAGLFTGRTFFFNLAYLFGGLMLLSLIWSLLAIGGVRIGRRTRVRRSQVGRTFSEEFTVRNGFFLPKLWLEVRDDSDLPGHRASHVIPPLLPGRSFGWRVETPCVVRGEFELGPMLVISGDPFGFYSTPRHIDAAESIIVYPRIVPLNNFNLPTGLISGGEAQQHLTQNITTNAAGVRDYVPGDSINRIHWKSTARRSKLIVKEFEIDPMVDIWMFVDFSRESLAEEPGLRRFAEHGAVIPMNDQIPPSTEEYNVVIAASLASYFIEDERALGFAAYAPSREVYQPERGHRQLTRILETLAVARSLSEYSMREMLALEMPHITRGATIIVITSSLDKNWVPELQAFSRRGIRPMCIFTDPSTFGSAVSTEEMRGSLQLARIPTLHVRKGDALQQVLSQRPY